MGAVGGFGGLFDLAGIAYTEPVLVAGSDGVGTLIIRKKKEDVGSLLGRQEGR